MSKSKSKKKAGVKKKEKTLKAATQAAVAQQPAPQPTSPPAPSPQKVEEETKISGMGPIRAYEFDPHFKYEIGRMHGGENLKHCFQCGTCTSDCPIARFSGSYRPRTLIRMTLLGLKDRVLSSDTLWLCAACFTCTDRCPQDVEVASIIRILRNAAVDRGVVPRIFKELGLSILESGIAYRIPELRLKKREEIGLPPLPKGNPEALVKIAKATGFSKTLKKGEKS